MAAHKKQKYGAGRYPKPVTIKAKLDQWVKLAKAVQIFKLSNTNMMKMIKKGDIPYTRLSDGPLRIDQIMVHVGQTLEAIEARYNLGKLQNQIAGGAKKKVTESGIKPPPGSYQDKMIRRKRVEYYQPGVHDWVRPHLHGISGKAPVKGPKSKPTDNAEQ